MSRQSAYQHRHRAAGLCWLCPEPVVRGLTLCATHLLAVCVANRRRAGCKAWTPGGKGRPPLTANGGRGKNAMRKKPKKQYATAQTERECPAYHHEYRGRTLTCPKCGVAAPHPRWPDLEEAADARPEETVEGELRATASRERVPAAVFPPGDFLREEMDARGWSAETVCRESGLTRAVVEELLSGHRKVTPAFARILGRAFGTGWGYWMGVQQAWDARGK